MVHEIRIPSLNPNEEEVFVAEVLVAVGDKISEGDILLVLETSKAAVELDAPGDGFVRTLAVREGEYARVGEPALVLAEEFSEGTATAEPDGYPAAGNETVPSVPIATSLDSSATGGRSTAKRRLLEKKARTASRERVPAASSVRPMDSAALPWVAEARKSLAELPLLADFTSLADLEPGRDDNARIGRDVVFGPGSTIRARRLVIRDGASIGPNVHIEADELFLGAYVHIGRDTRIMTGECVLGDGAYVGHEVEVDLSGGRSPESRLLCGPISLVSPRCYVNTCREVVLEEESALSPGAQVFTHRFWQSVLDGYPAVFASVRLRERSWVGAGCQVMAGVEVGRGAVVMSNSTVVHQVPEESLCGGVPAVVLRKRARKPVPPGRKPELLASILEEFAGHLSSRGCAVERLSGHSGRAGLRVGLPDGETRDVVLFTAGAERPEAGSVVIAFDAGPPEVPGGSLFDIDGRAFSGRSDRLTHELRNFLRRRGVRFRPYAWDASYRHGL